MNRKERRAEAKTVKAGALPLALAAAFGEAVRLHQAGRLAEAEAYYRHVLAAHPQHADSRHLMGVLAHQVGQPDVAEQLIREAIALEPRMGAFHANLGNVLRAQGRYAEAAAALERSLELDPGVAKAHYDLASAYAALDRPEAAIPHFRQAIALRPDYAEAHNDLATVLKGRGDVDAAIDAFRAAIRADPGHAKAHANLGMALLARGDFAEGWRAYERRWDAGGGFAARRDFSQPQWRGEDGVGRTLLIHAEQGFGDAIQFCRYALLARDRGFRIVLEAHPELAGLMKSLDGVDQVIARGEPLPAFDLHCPMLSLPLAFETTPETIPAAGPYLSAEPDLADVWRERVGLAAGLRVGIAWAGGRQTATDAQRSLSPDLLAPLLAVPGLRLFSLQKDEAAPAGVIDLMADAKDFADTAALIANLDLIISVDTAVAHLAGALGKPVWLLDRFDPDWRWLLGRKDSPWYPTMTIYRQPSPGNWGAVVEAVLDHLSRREREGPAA
jgi:tetratricopeptide (TPR) repeat protein